MNKTPTAGKGERGTSGSCVPGIHDLLDRSEALALASLATGTAACHTPPKKEGHEHINSFFYSYKEKKKTCSSDIYLGALHFAVDTLASVAFFLPAAAMRKLKSSIVTGLPNANNCTTTQTKTP